LSWAKGRDAESRRVTHCVTRANTPDGPPNHLASTDVEMVMRRMTETFTRAFLPSLPWRV
jgi:hypothetical protein